MSPRGSRPGSPRARLFVALDLPADARADLVEWRARAFAGRADVRLLDPAALHVTLVFLGYRPEKEIERIGELVRGAVAAREAPLHAATGVKPLPPRRPRLFALDLSDAGGRGVELQQAVSDALEAERIYKPEKRPFWPHVTLARVKSRVPHAEPLGEVPAPPPGEWRGQAVTLYRSILRPQSAQYIALERVPLKG